LAAEFRPPRYPFGSSFSLVRSLNGADNIPAAPQPPPKETTMFVPYYPDVVKRAEELNVEILESYVRDSRLHQLINNPVTEGIDEG
jgi:hypothetical protein